MNDKARSSMRVRAKWVRGTPRGVRLGWQLVILVTLVTSLGMGKAMAVPSESVRGGGPPVPSLAWSDCGDGFECSDANVPLDYRVPFGRTITLHLIRRPAADPARRIGTLLMQPGGPGGSGVVLCP